MTNLTPSHVNWLLAITWAYAVVVVITVVVTACTVPHDFGMYNNLKTICHVWKGRDGYRRQDTQHINRKNNIHGGHAWDYDGECEE